MKTRIISLVLAFTMLFGCFPSTFAASALTDVENTKYESAVESLEILGIVNGYEDNTYRPEKEVSRAEMAKLLIIAAGLEEAAKVSNGATKFTDVDEDYWATGYINVAAQYGFINGYPEGTFAPDAPVKYSEATTMALRVLGYKSMIESKGTWPTNYIAKAQELKVLEGIVYNKYTDNATRGDVALLIWNILIVPTWGIVGESETDGLNYGYCPSLLDLHFEDYMYASEDEGLIVENIDVSDGSVIITFNHSTPIELDTNVEFLNLKGRAVSALYNIKENKIVQLTPSTEDKVIEGYRDVLSGDKYNLTNTSEKIWGTDAQEETDYIVGILGDNKKIEHATRYSLKSSIIVEEVEIKDDVLKINKNELTINSTAIVLINDEWKTINDIKENDVITVLKDGELYVVSRDIITGEFEGVTELKDETETKHYVTVDGKKYSVLNGVKEVIELDENNKEITRETLANIIKNDESKYYGEEVTIYTDFLGEVVRIAFEEIKEEKDMGAFNVLTYVPASWTDIVKGKVITYVELNGKEYEVAEGVTVPTENKSGDVVYVKFDKEDKVTAIYNVLTSGDAFSGDYIIKVVKDEKAILDKDNYISGDYKVTNSTIVVKITAVEKDNVVEGYKVEIVRDASYLEGVKYAVVAIESGDVFEKASYVFVWEDAKNTDKDYGVASMYKKENGKEYLTIEGKEYEIGEVEIAFTNSIETYVGRAVEFIDNDTVKITKSYGSGDVETAKVVANVDGSQYEISGDKVYDLDIKDLDNKRILVAEMEEDRFTTLEEIDADEINLKKNDRIIEDADIFLIIKGYEK